MMLRHQFKRTQHALAPLCYGASIHYISLVPSRTQTLQHIANSVESYSNLRRLTFPEIYPRPQRLSSCVNQWSGVRSMSSSVTSTPINTSSHIDRTGDLKEDSSQITCFESTPCAAVKNPEVKANAQPNSEDIPLEKVLVHYVCGYVYCPVHDPHSIRREILERLAPYTGLGGRVYISTNGMNVQLSVPTTILDLVKDVIYTVGSGVFQSKIRLFSMDPTPIIGHEMFSNLTIRVRPLLNEGLDKAFSDSLDAYMETMNHLSPEQWHNQLGAAYEHIKLAKEARSNGSKEIQEPPIVLDVRNLYEYEVGGFRGALPVVVDAFRHTFTELDRMLGLPSGSTHEVIKQDQGSLDQVSAGPTPPQATGPLIHTVSTNPAISQAESLIPTPSTPVDRNRKMFLYCTGGIRCMKVGAYLVSRGFTDVNVLEGGVNSYAQYIQHKYPDPEERDANSLYRGTNVMFDDRRGTRITSDVLSRCHQCGEPCDTTRNCNLNACDLLLIQCSRCEQAYHGCCSAECTTKTGHVLQTELLPEGLEIVQHTVTKERVRPRIAPLTRPVEGVIE